MNGLYPESLHETRFTLHDGFAQPLHLGAQSLLHHMHEEADMFSTYRKSRTSIALAFMASGVATVAADELGTCSGADFVHAVLKQSGSSGYYVPGLKLIVLNETVLKEFSLPVRKFIFAHECAHADPDILDDEGAADCAAARRGVAEGWLGKQEIVQVCAHLARFPADASHRPIG